MAGQAARMGMVERATFEWPIWLGVAALAGFLAALLAVVAAAAASSWDSLALFHPVLERQGALLVLSSMLSLPALAHQILMRQSGLNAYLYYPATVLGGWIMLGGVAEAMILVVDTSRTVPFTDINGDDAVLVGGTLAGCALTAYFQSFALPRSIRFFYRWVGAIVAPVGMAVAVAAAVGLLSLLRENLFWNLAFGIGIGWAVIAGAIGWPIQKAIRELERGRAPV
jgi:hypothetical protein